MSANQSEAFTAQQPTNQNSTRFYLRELQLSGAGTFALISIDNRNPRKPATFSFDSLQDLARLLEKVRARAAKGDFSGIGVTGHHRTFVAGADLAAMRGILDPASARKLARLGHDVFGLLSSMNVPTFAFINGAAIGGGLELALAAEYRSVSAAVKRVSLPEAYLGLIPGWGGIYRLPRLIGPENGVKVMIENALSNNKTLDGKSAFGFGISDVIFQPDDFLEESIAWATRIIRGDREEQERLNVRRAEKSTYTELDWDSAIATGRAFVELKTATSTPAPGRLLDLLQEGQRLTRTESADREVEALTDLMLTPEFKDSAYALLDLVHRATKNPAGFPDSELARPIRKVAVIGAGLMACQLALLFARQLKVPVVLNDIDQARVQSGLDRVHADLDKLVARQSLTREEGSSIKSLVTGSVSKKAFADADFVIEAVFEELSVKKKVFAEVEAVVSDDCVLATNTSSLSVTEMASDLLHPERLVGFHFFNPVAAMPLLEIIRAPKTSDHILATAYELSRALQKTPVLVRDSTAFVVNRLLLRLMGEVFDAFDEGTPAEIADNALRPMGLPMTPFDLLAMIGPPVFQHVTKSLNASFGTRFKVSANQQRLVDHGIPSLWSKDQDGLPCIPPDTAKLLKFSNSPSTAEKLLVRVQDALAKEVHLLLQEGVVATPQDIDLCMIGGAGWPLHLGGITPYLDRTGSSTRV